MCFTPKFLFLGDGRSVKIVFKLEQDYVFLMPIKVQILFYTEMTVNPVYNANRMKVNTVESMYNKIPSTFFIFR